MKMNVQCSFKQRKSKEPVDQWKKMLLHRQTNIDCKSKTYSLENTGSAQQFSALFRVIPAYLFESKVRQKHEEKNWYFSMTNDTVMMFLFAYRQLLGWVMRCFKHWYTFKPTHTGHCYRHTECTTLGDTCTTPTNTMLWRIQTLISWTKWKMSF